MYKGGCPSTVCSAAVPVSNDTYSGFAASGYGPVGISDWGGTADKLILPFASTDLYFETYDQDGYGGEETLILMSSSTDGVSINGQLKQVYPGLKGFIEQIVLTDGTITIGSENAVQTLNSASKLDASEKEKRKEGVKKVIEETKEKDKENKSQEAKDSDGDKQQQSPSSPSGEKKR